MSAPVSVWNAVDVHDALISIANALVPRIGTLLGNYRLR
jgi:hypothetical protein